jgi:DNA-binding transcriptional regulator LsrR (DeoR family)
MRQKRKAPSDGVAKRRKRTKAGASRSAAERVDPDRILALVCHYFCEGKSPSEIKRVMWERHAIEISRETPYKALSIAASRHWLRFVSPKEDVLGERLRARYPWLQAEVLSSVGVEGVATRAAEVIVELLCERATRLKKDTLAVGWAGGHSTGLVAKRLAGLLAEPREGLPKKVVFHSLTAGFDVQTIVTDPNAFLSYIVGSPSVQIKTGFVGLRAPAIVRLDQREELLALPGVKEAYDLAGSLDLVVTAAGVRDDEHSMLHRYYDRYSPTTVDFLKRSGYVGDYLWWPLRPTEPVSLEEAQADADADELYWALTLLDPTRLHRLVNDGANVLLVMGPCTYCFQDKSTVLGAVLKQRHRLVTHLVADSRSVRTFLEAEEKSGG